VTSGVLSLLPPDLPEQTGAKGEKGSCLRGQKAMWSKVNWECILIKEGGEFPKSKLSRPTSGDPGGGNGATGRENYLKKMKGEGMARAVLVAMRKDVGKG